jgi:eukaryotic-like serine/threonine-protein kinase
MSVPNTNVLEHLKAALSDRYAVQREIGRGGMATVYLANDLKHDREIAVKVLHPQVTVTLGADRFLREIQIAAKLNHPHIVALYDSGEAGGMLYYVMPFIKGESLRLRLKRDKPLGIDQALGIIQDVASALHYAHGQGVIHRDIKPENILVHEGEAMVADFGIALALSAAGGERITETGVALGTPEYMSPEQISASGELDARSDIYSLACVLYEMLTGEPPYLGSTTLAVMAKQLVDAAPSARRLRESVSPGTDRALKRALAKSPVDRFRTVTEFVEALITGETASDAAAPKSLVVLPFANLSADSENEYFSDGLTEEIIADLSKTPGLRVVSRTSAMRLKGTDKDLKTIGREVNVRYILEGSVRKAGNNLRITAQLIDVANDTHLWAEKYTATTENIFDIQEQVSRSIAGAIRVTLSPREEQQIPRPRRGGWGDHFRRYLWDRYHWYRFTPDGVQKSRKQFEDAVQRDPTYAAAHVGVADAYLMLGGGPLTILPPAEAIPRVKQAATKAIELDPSNAGAYESLALAQCWFEGEWEAARQTAIRGTQVDPNSGSAWRAYAHTHSVCGFHVDAARGAARLLEIDPTSPLYHSAAAWIHGHARNYSHAEQLVRRARELEAKFPLAAFIEAEILSAQGNHAGALAVMEPWRDVMRDFDYGLAILAFTLARNGRRDDALRIAGDLEEKCTVGRAAWSDVALVHLGLGSKDRSLAFLQRASEQKPFGGLMTAHLAVHPLFDPLRHESAFVHVLRVLRLDSYARIDRASTPSRQS